MGSRRNGKSGPKMFNYFLIFAFIASVAPFVIRPDDGAEDGSSEFVAVSGEDVAPDGEEIAKQNYLHHSGGYHHHHHIGHHGHHGHHHHHHHTPHYHHGHHYQHHGHHHG